MTETTLMIVLIAVGVPILLLLGVFGLLLLLLPPSN